MQNLILNRYRPLDVAGSGGYGTVHVAWDTRIQRRVAIKCLQLDTFGTAATPGTPREIPGLDEARTAAMLSDSHIVGVYDFEIEGPTAYLIMEYMDGITLTDLMRAARGPLPLDVLTCVFESVAHAIEVAHDNQVLHLDIKPDNVLINRQGQVKVADFGLAQLSHEAGYGQAAGGTIGYMPLEQMRLEAPDVRTDEWALAALTYQMLTGDNPFLAHDLAGAARAIEEAEIVIPSLIRDDVGEEVDEAVFGALAIDRADRFESVMLFADALMPHLGDARQGARLLAAIVGDACADEPEEEDEEADDATDQMPAVMRVRRSLSERLRGGVGEGIVRIWSALACGVTAYAGLSAAGAGGLAALGGTGQTGLWALACAAAIMGAAFPRAGSAAALACVAGGLALRGSIVAAGVFFAGVLWWWLACGRLGKFQSIVGAGVIACSFSGALALVPLAAAYCLRIRDALCTVLFAMVAAFSAAFGGVGSLTGGGLFVAAGPQTGSALADAKGIFVQLTDSGMWALAASWVVAAAVGAALCSHGGKVRAALGMAASSCILALGLAGRSLMESGSIAGALDPAELAVLVVAGAVATVCAGWLGVPKRSWLKHGYGRESVHSGNGYYYPQESAPMAPPSPQQPGPHYGESESFYGTDASREFDSRRW